MSGPAPVPATLLPYDAVVLTGGRARRLGGVDKPGVEVGGRAMGRRVLDAVTSAARVVVVGRPVHRARVDVVTCESPPGGGPVAALAAGLASVTAPVVACLAADLPFLSAAAVDELRAALAGQPSAGVALYVDAGGRDQLLGAVWRTAAARDAVTALAAARGGHLDGAPVRELIALAGPVLRRTVSVSSGPPPWFDCDTEADLAQARRWLGPGPR